MYFVEGADHQSDLRTFTEHHSHEMTCLLLEISINCVRKHPQHEPFDTIYRKWGVQWLSLGAVYQLERCDCFCLKAWQAAPPTRIEARLSDRDHAFTDDSGGV